MNPKAIECFATLEVFLVIKLMEHLLLVANSNP